MNEQIGDRIAKCRKKLNITQNKLAEMLCVSDKAVSKWESNKCSPSIDLLPNLSQILNCSIDYLVIGEKNNEENLDNNYNDGTYSINEIKELQTRFKELIKSKISTVTYDLWILPIQFLGINGSTLNIATTSGNARERLVSKAFNETVECLKQLNENIQELNIIVDSSFYYNELDKPVRLSTDQR